MVAPAGTVCGIIITVAVGSVMVNFPLDVWSMVHPLSNVYVPLLYTPSITIDSTDVGAKGILNSRAVSTCLKLRGMLLLKSPSTSMEAVTRSTCLLRSEGMVYVIFGVPVVVTLAPSTILGANAKVLNLPWAVSFSISFHAILVFEVSLSPSKEKSASDIFPQGVRVSLHVS